MPYIVANRATEMWNEMRARLGMTEVAKPLPGYCNFQHLTGGYDVGYYGSVCCTMTSRQFHLTNAFNSYTYSLVFAADMYATVFKADPFDSARWQRYREKILVPGASRDEMETLTVSISNIHYNLSGVVYLIPTLGLLGPSAEVGCFHSTVVRG